ncbi:hypothetical protein MMC25_000105 [Agyrium rufum]|nr:hypothetical protein [Agyrium rufum]
MSAKTNGQSAKPAKMVAPKVSSPETAILGANDTKNANSASSAAKMHRRSRSGCFTCRLRRKKCDEVKPHCKACNNLGLCCEYKRPIWWGNNEQRRNQKEEIKNIIKRTKLNEKASQVASGIESPPGLSHSLPTSATYSDMTARTRAASTDSHGSAHFDFNRPPIKSESYDSYHPHVYTPSFDIHQYHPYSSYPPTPYEVDIKTERQTFINDVPTRRDSTTSTFSIYHTPSTHSHFPMIPEETWEQEGVYETPNEFLAPGEEGVHFDYFDFSHAMPLSTPSPAIEVDDCDRPLLDHFIENVLRSVFPILEVSQHGTARTEVILPALQTNKTYLHCCLSVAATHLKSIRGVADEQLDSDIVRHRYATIAELCAALQRDTDHAQILDAALGMIIFRCAVGGSDDDLPDIPWHKHFEAASNLVKKLELPHTLVHSDTAQIHPPFNMTLTSWIDILGATMRGTAPLFADTYREKHFSLSDSGLTELMGCQDRLMYLISEIACLESLRINQSLDDIQLCSHIELLGQQMDFSGPDEVDTPYSPNGTLKARQLSCNMTAIFRVASRIWLCSLVPGYSVYDHTMMDLVAKFSSYMDFIPSGPGGFDRSLVWPLLIAGAHSTPGSSFRHMFATRTEQMGEEAEFGSFGRMKRVLQEVWLQSDMGAPGAERRNVHWRDVMQQKCWDFLLI